MAYTALYRRYRPDRFGDVIGQEHITRTLRNQIQRNSVNHAYLFTGTRGIGKTSVARILARAVNCISPVDGEPCGVCDSCVMLSNPNIDIYELDAASNNGVDQVRELRDNAVFPPTFSKYKVYIIDEVHMLTGAAFNALLKTLEEPPAHAIFILCTTEAHRIPATILSRCMRFDFRLVSAEGIYKHLAGVFAELNKEYEESALYLIAENAQGSVRDALSLADRCLLISEGKLTYGETAQALGASNVFELRDFIGSMLTGDEGGVFRNAEKLLQGGKSSSVLARETSAYFRNLLVAKTVSDVESILKLPADMLIPIVIDSQVADIDKLLFAAEIFTKLEGELRYSIFPRAALEAAALKVALYVNEYRELSQRIDALEKKVFGERKTSDVDLSDSKSILAAITKEVREQDSLLFDIMRDVAGAEYTNGILEISMSEMSMGMLRADRDRYGKLIMIVNRVCNARLKLKASDRESEQDRIKRLEAIADGKLTVK